MLVNYDHSCNLWVDLNAFKEFGFIAILFHVRQREEKMSEKMWPKRSTVEPIFFLSRPLTTAEKNYWPTKLEITGFV